MQIDLTLSDKQWEVFNAPVKPVNVFLAGRRVGKSELGVRWQCCNFALSLGTEEDSPHAWIAPTYKQAKIGMVKWLRFLRQNKIPHKANNSDLYIDLFNGFSRVQFFSTDSAHNIEGFSFMSLVVDESQFVLKKREVWENTLAACLIDHDAPVLFIGKAFYKGLFEELYLKGGTSALSKSLKYRLCK